MNRNNLAEILQRTSWYTHSPLMPNIQELVKAILNPDSVKKGSDRTVFLKDHYVLKWSISDGQSKHRQNEEEIHSYFLHYIPSSTSRIDLAEIYGYSKGAVVKGLPDILEYEFLVMERLGTTGPSLGFAPWPYTLIDGGQVGVDKNNNVKCFDYGNLQSLLRNQSYRTIFGMS